MPRSGKKGSLGKELASVRRSLRALEQSLVRLAAQVRDIKAEQRLHAEREAPPQAQADASPPKGPPAARSVPWLHEAAQVEGQGGGARPSCEERRQGGDQAGEEAGGQMTDAPLCRRTVKEVPARLGIRARIKCLTLVYNRRVTSSVRSIGGWRA